MQSEARRLNPACDVKFCSPQPQVAFSEIYYCRGRPNTRALPNRNSKMVRSSCKNIQNPTNTIGLTGKFLTLELAKEMKY